MDTPLANTSAVEGDPCSAITNAQIEALGVKVKKTRLDDLSLGKNCGWIFEDTGNINGGMTVGNKEGLSGIYRQHAQGGVTTFKPVPPIEGFPAVVYANGGERPYVCTLAVGVRNDLVYTVVSQLDKGNPFYDDACTLNAKIAGLAIKNLKGA